MSDKSSRAAKKPPTQVQRGAAPKKGRPVKEPPPPKLWRVIGRSPDGLKVSLGRFTTKEEAQPEFDRLQDDGFYTKLKIIQVRE